MTTIAPDLAVIDLLGDCTDDGCRLMAEERLDQLDCPKYRDGVSLMRIPEMYGDWRASHRTARKRAARCARLGYWFSAVLDRGDYQDDIYEINTSLAQRQGRPMGDGYLTRNLPGRLPDYPCPHHYVRFYGVLEGDRLRAYLTLYRVGDLGMVSMILGHGDHLKNDVMYLLWAGVVSVQAGTRGHFYYNRHDSGQDGLVFFKERLGFRKGDVEWSM